MRKYLSEFGLFMVGTPYAICRQSQLDAVEATALTDDAAIHIYSICVRPKLTLEPESIAISKDRIKGTFKAQIQEKSIPIHFDEPNIYGTEDIKLQTKYPYSEFTLMTPDGRVSGGEVAHVLAHMKNVGMPPESHPLLDLEVLYVGQSYGEAGERNAVTRLRKHETLQAIYADINERMPDKDVWIILWLFNEAQYQTIHFGGLAEGGDGIANQDHVDKIEKNPISGEQKVNFTEAAMIRYLQPPYNVKFKDRFPAPEHISYEECYTVDLNLVAIELQMQSVGMRLYSESVPRGFFHVATFPLHSPDERANMFDFVDVNVALENGPVF